jgi:hypothetical protein
MTQTRIHACASWLVFGGCCFVAEKSFARQKRDAAASGLSRQWQGVNYVNHGGIDAVCHYCQGQAAASAQIRVASPDYPLRRLQRAVCW